MEGKLFPPGSGNEKATGELCRYGPVTDGSVKRFEQFLRGEWLDEEIAVRAEGCHICKNGRSWVGAGNKDDFARGREFTNAQGGFDSIDAVHVDISDDRDGMAGAGCLDGGFTAQSATGIEAVLLQYKGERFGDDRFVVDDEDGWALG